MDTLELRYEEFSALGFSAGFCSKSRQMGFQRLDDVLKLSPEELVSKEEFSYIWLGELSAFLEKNKQLHLLQPLPGRNPL